MKPTQEQIDREVAACRDMEKRFPVRDRVDQTAYLVALADRVAELERERAETITALRAIFPAALAPPDDDTCDDTDAICGKCGMLCSVEEGLDFEPGDPCYGCALDAYMAARALVARLESKGATE